MVELFKDGNVMAIKTDCINEVDFNEQFSDAVHSMIEDNILERDLALIREQPAVENGTTAAVLIFAEGQAEAEGTLKHYYKESDHHRLEPRNANEPTIVVIPVQADVDRITAHYRQQGKQILVRVGEARVLGKLVGLFREVD